MDGEIIYLKRISPGDICNSNRNSNKSTTFVDPSTNNPIYLPSNTPVSRVDNTTARSVLNGSLISNSNDSIYGRNKSRSINSGDTK